MKDGGAGCVPGAGTGRPWQRLGAGGKAEMPFQPGEASMPTVTLRLHVLCSSPPTAPRVSGWELFPQQTPDKTLQHSQHRHRGRLEGPRGSGPPVGQKQQREEGGTESEGGRGRGRAQDGRRGPELVLVLGCVMLQGAALEGPRPTFQV